MTDAALKEGETLRNRVKVPAQVVRDVLTEAGYRCGVPTCRSILAIDLHHIELVAERGSNELSNLLALCPTCHALYHRGTISRESIYAWKAMLVALNGAFDIDAIDKLLFLRKLPARQLAVSGDGVLQFARLIAADLATFRILMQNGPIITYELMITEKGKLLVDAWCKGERAVLEKVLAMGGRSQVEVAA